jgi:GNAT superfamily N-acetyltransferase
MHCCKNGLELTDDPTRIDVETVTRFLDATYWAAGRSVDDMVKAIEGSRPFGVYDETGAQVAFARVVSDGIYFAWLADVIVDPAYRGQGVGKWLVRVICDRPEYRSMTMTLQTRDAHSLYERHGFRAAEMMKRSAE